jgi:hypothetical protein
MTDLLKRHRGALIAAAAALLFLCAGSLAATPPRASAQPDCDSIVDPSMQDVCPPTPTVALVPPVSATPVPDEFEEDVLGVVQPPAVGTGGLPDDWPHRARKLAAQGFAGRGGALLLVGATRWVAGRRERR